MRIDIITLFPEIALSPLSDSIIKRAREQGLVDIHAHQLRDWATGKASQNRRLPLWWWSRNAHDARAGFRSCR